MERYDDAIASYNKALLLDKEDGDIYYGLGTAYSSKGEYKKAISYYEKALGKKNRISSDAEIYESMANMYGIVGDTINADRCRKKAETSGR